MSAKNVHTLVMLVLAFLTAHLLAANARNCRAACDGKCKNIKYVHICGSGWQEFKFVNCLGCSNRTPVTTDCEVTTNVQCKVYSETGVTQGVRRIVNAGSQCTCGPGIVFLEALDPELTEDTFLRCAWVTCDGKKPT